MEHDIIEPLPVDDLIKCRQAIIVKCRNSTNYCHDPRRGEVNVLPSLTVPDQSMSVQEILKRHVRGQSTMVGMDGEYDDYIEGDDDPEFMPDPTKMDLIDRKVYQEDYQAELEQITKKIKSPKTKTNEPEKTDPPPAGAGGEQPPAE